DRGLAHRLRGPGAICLRHTTGRPRFLRLERVDGPRGVQRNAERPVHETARFGKEVLHGLERADGGAGLPPFPRVVDGDVEAPTHHADEVGAGEGQPESRPRGEVVRREDLASVGYFVCRSSRGDDVDRTREIRAAVRFARPAVERYLHQTKTLALGRKRVRGASTG